MAARFKDLTGQKFNRLTAVEFVGFRQYEGERKRVWRWRCDCGNEIECPAVYVTGARARKSCGCIIGKHKRTHGATGTTEFRIWDAMRRRCHDPKNDNYRNYGARGIQVCERWRSDFAAFLADMGPRPSPRHSLDRYPNNDGNYEPGNCRWATMREQSNNRRSSRLLTIGDETKTLAEWEHQYGLKPGIVFRRLRYGWPPERVIQKPRVYRRGVERVIPTQIGA